MRAYTAADRADCLVIFDSNVPESFTVPERPQFETFLDHLPGPYFVVVEEAGGLVACGGYAIEPGTTCADLCWGMVRRDRQGEGLGRLLTEQRLARIVADDQAVDVALRTSHLTRAFYERLGFVVGRIIPDGIAPGLDLCIMRLTLAREQRTSAMDAGTKRFSSRPMAITLYTAAPSDAGDIASLLRASWAATYGSVLTPDELNTVAQEWHHPDRLRHQMLNPRVGFLVARTDAGALVGVATVKRSDDDATISVLRLYVLPDYQGQGIGSQLLSRALAAFPNAQRIELQVAEGNPSGLSFWMKRGFRACGQDEARIGDTTLALISMERTVAA